MDRLWPLSAHGKVGDHSMGRESHQLLLPPMGNALTLILAKQASFF